MVKTKESKEALLFHPKKKKVVASTSSPSPKPAPSPSQSSSQTSNRATSSSTSSLDEQLNLPDGPFSEFKVMSSALNGWKYDVMKFESRKPVDISTWQTPVKLNRKELRRADDSASKTGVAVQPMLGIDGKPVMDQYGRQVMVDKDGRPIHLGADGLPLLPPSADTNGKGKEKGGRFGKKNTKKVKQVFKTSEEVRLMRKEERYPWVIEDAPKSEVWIASMEETSKADTHAFFMPAANETFKFVPAHRWYKFQKKFNHYVPTLEEAEKVMDQIKKNKDPQTWLLHRRNGQTPSAATSAIFKAEADGRDVVIGGSSLVYGHGGQSLGPGGRRLKAVDSGGDLFGDDEDEGDTKRRRNERGAEGDLDEVEFEEEFADDEEKMDVDDKEDEEAKELEERLKREYKNANREHDPDDEEEDESQLTKEGKKMKKIIKSLDKSNMYDSDEEKNPYASSDEGEEEEEEEEIPTMTQSQQQQQQQSQQTPPASQTPTPSDSQQGLKSPTVPSTPASTSVSRAGSPIPASQSGSLGGHSVVAKRATSPKIPKPKATNGISRGNSPLAGGGSRAGSPISGSRATSPVGGGNIAGSKTNGVNGNKRKAMDDSVNSPAPNGVSNGVQKPHKKRKAMPSSAGIPVGDLDDKTVIDWLRNTPNASTRDCIQHFTPYLTDEAKKAKFTALVKEVAQLKGGILVLKSSYRERAAGVAQ